MEEEIRDPKREYEEKLRCASFLLEMIEKYGPELLAEEQNKEIEENK